MRGNIPSVIFIKKYVISFYPNFWDRALRTLRISLRDENYKASFATLMR